MSVRLLSLAFSTLLPAALAQDPAHVAYPERDALTPFRAPAEVYAPPDRLYSLLRRMRAMAANEADARTVDGLGREVVESDKWRDMRNEVQRIGLDAGYLASIMRMSKNADDRRTAFYAMFWCDRVDYVLNLISHIPGEPVRATRQEAMPRAVDYLRVHLRRRFGDLDDEQKKALIDQMPAIGSPAARAQGITRLPRDDDHLNFLNLKPFFQLLDVDAAIDQAQAMWFLKEVFTIRRDLAAAWLEPALPRVRQLLFAEDRTLRDETIGLLRAIGPKDLPDPPEDATALRDWAEVAIKGMFPPIRNVNDALVQLFPSPERDAVVAAGIAALESSAIGDAFRGRDEAGQHYAGFRVVRVPEALAPLAIPAGAVITTVNGAPVQDAASLLQTVRGLIANLAHPRILLVEYVLDGKGHAIEYRVM